jgi:adenosine kinase
MLVCNDYEFDLICEKSGKTPAELLAMVQHLIVTLGEKGSRVQTGGVTEHVPAVPPRAVADPTGAGDAYRAGLLKGLSLNLSVPEAARIGATAASFCVETRGTQALFSAAECRERHKKTFGAAF